MRKSLPLILLCFSLLCFLGCTISKRRYTGGYSVTWHSKVIETRAMQPIIQRPTNHIARSQTEVNNNIELKNENNPDVKIRTTISVSRSEKVIPKSISNYRLPDFNPPRDSITFDDTSVYTKPSRMAPPAFGFLSILCAALSYVLIQILSIAGLAGIYLLLPISALFLTILFAYMAMHKARILLKDYHLQRDKTWSIVGIILAFIGLLIGVLGLLGTLILLGLS